MGRELLQQWEAQINVPPASKTNCKTGLGLGANTQERIHSKGMNSKHLNNEVQIDGTAEIMKGVGQGFSTELTLELSLLE